MSGEKIGTVYAVGFGPGDECYETIEAREVLAGVDVIVGYQTYVKLLEAQFPEKRFLVSGMHAEEARCREALRLACEGQNVAVVSSGDSAVYGMAGLLYTLSEEDAYRGVQVVTVPGLSAVLSGSAVLGAPVGHDFCVISLSDLLTPWARIEQRLKAAAEADFVIVLYNPVSRTRQLQYQRACAILSETLPEDRVCAYVRNIGRDGQRSRIFLLNELAGLATGTEELATDGGALHPEERIYAGYDSASMKELTTGGVHSSAEAQPEIDMLTTIFIGNSETRVIETPDGPRMVTPRGYERKHEKNSTSQVDG